MDDTERQESISKAWQNASAPVVPKRKPGRPRLDGLTKEDYEKLGQRWEDTPEYNREYQRKRRAALREAQAELAARREVMLEQKRRMNMLPSQQTPVYSLTNPNTLPTPPTYDPILRPDGVPWDIPLTEELAAEKAANDALPPEEKDKNISWALLGLLAERGAWKNGTHRDQQTG